MFTDGGTSWTTPARAAIRRATLAHGLHLPDPGLLSMLLEDARRMVPSLPAPSTVEGSRGVCVVYFLRLSNGWIYVGCSTDLELRLADHVKGQA